MLSSSMAHGFRENRYIILEVLFPQVIICVKQWYYEEEIKLGL